MIVNIQFNEAADLLWEMFDAVSEDKREQFSLRVDKVSSALRHPDLGGAIILSISLNSADQSTGTLRGVVLPL